MPATQAQIDARRATRKAFEPNPPPVLFVGGTGRSGTHIASRLLGKSPHLALIRVECRFHTDDEGFPGLLAGDVSKASFVRRMRGFWWKGFQTNRVRGLHRFVPRDRLDAALSEFDAGFDADAPPRAGAVLRPALAGGGVRSGRPLGSSSRAAT